MSSRILGHKWSSICLYMDCRLPCTCPFLYTACPSQGHPVPLICQVREALQLPSINLRTFILLVSVGAQAPEELIFRWSAVGDPLVFQVPWRKEIKLASNQANLLSNHLAPGGNLLQSSTKLSSWRRISKALLPQTNSKTYFMVLTSNIEPFPIGSVQSSHLVLQGRHV